MSQILTQTIKDYLVKTIPDFIDNCVQVDTQDQETLVTLSYKQVNFKFGLDLVNPELDPDLLVLLDHFSKEVLES